MAATPAKGSPEGERPVTVHECEVKYKATRNQLTFMIALMSMFLAGVGWSVLAAYNAQFEAAQSQHALEAHNAAQLEMVKRIEEKLGGIEKGVDTNTEELKEQRKLLEGIWRSNGHHLGTPPGGSGVP
jgi:hypothetical protein